MAEKSLNPRVGVGVFVFKDGKLLIGQRRGSHGEGSWTVPGGHLEYGETPEQTAEREVREETGLQIANVAFSAVTNDIFEEEGKHYVTLWMRSDWVSGEPTIAEPDKYINQRWVDFDTLPEPLFLPWKQLLKSEFIEPLKQYAARR
jgi:8-oxo-dGTP diphosphatase